jgi:microcompartment protein CcmK/EutM
MHLYKVNGNVTLSRCHPAFVGARLNTAIPHGESLLEKSPGETPESPDFIVVWDDLGANLGSIIAVSDGAEAAQAFKPALKPVDAYNSAILDAVEIDSNLITNLRKLVN